MILFDLFRKKNECQHTKVSPDKDYSYCPDCGLLIENRWYITRCACCGVKLKAIIKNNQFIPDEHYCHNCGAADFIIEQVDKINFIDINYAVLVKVPVIPECNQFTQSWVEREVCGKRKLISG